MKRAKPGGDIYKEDLPVVEPSSSGDMPFDCDGCHRLFTVQELSEFAMPHLNRGQQWGVIKCPACGYGTKVTFAADSKQ